MKPRLRARDPCMSYPPFKSHLLVLLCLAAAPARGQSTDPRLLEQPTAPYTDAAVSLGTGEVIEKKVRPLGPEVVRFTASKDGRTL